MNKILSLFLGILLLTGAAVLWITNKPEPIAVPPVVEAPKQEVAPIVLQKDGLGIVSFGATPEATIATVSKVLGIPTKDTGMVPSFSAYGTCPGEQIRGVEWNNFYVLFGDTVFGKNAFFQYGYTDTKDAPHVAALTTGKGLTLGMHTEELKTLYPEATIGDWLPGQKGFTLDKDGSGTGKYLGGTLIDDKVYWIAGGELCGE
jgi:hypothetical protein